MIVPSPGNIVSAPRPLRIGLIGSGRMGIHHLQAIAQLPGAVIVGVADPVATSESLKPWLPAEALVVASAEELLERLRPDVVHIVTPPATHARLAELALQSGANVYVEKPFTETRAEAERVLRLAAERGLKVCAGHQILMEEPARVSLQKISTIGRVVHVESYFSFRMIRRNISPVAQLKDVLPHAVYPLLQQLRHGVSAPGDTVRVVGIDAHASGDVYVLIRVGDRTGIIVVTLSGRPVEQYQHIVGTNGMLRADYVTGSVVGLAGPGAGIGAIFTPYRRSLQTLMGATRGFAKLILDRTTSYRGLRVLIEGFYSSIHKGYACPISPESIVDTVDVCERIGYALDEAELKAEAAATADLASAAVRLPSLDEKRGKVLVTGGSGFLGRAVVRELRSAGFAVRSTSRRVPPPSRRIAGVEYVAQDLGGVIDQAIFRDINALVHCAAETEGGKSEHERNSIAATRSILEATARANVKRVIYVSSLAVLKSGGRFEKKLDEASPVDVGNLHRGPYTWGKAEAEALVAPLSASYGLDVKIVRPGPLVDFSEFSPPGRLGRELGPLFVAIGPRKSPLSICDVSTAAKVIRSYLENFDSAPAILNMVEGTPPTRAQLVARLRAVRPDLKVLWIPSWLLWLFSGPIKLAQRLLLGSKNPIDISATFASEAYNTDLASKVIRRATSG